MKIIKFYMSKGEDILLPEDKALKIIDNEGQLIKIMEDGIWTGNSINKAHIVSTVVDKEATREAQPYRPRLQAPERDLKQIGSFLKKYKPKTI